MTDAHPRGARTYTNREEYPSASGRFVLVCERAYEYDPSGRFALPGMEQHLDFRDSGLKPGEARLTLFERTAGEQASRWSVPYDGFPPHAAYVADGGQHVVLRETSWCQGQGKVLVLLGPGGEVIRSYLLAEILPGYEIRRYIGYIHGEPWARHGILFFRRRETQFAFVTRGGTIRVFDLATGECLPLTDGLQEEVRAEALPLAREWLADSRPERRESGAVMVGALRDRDSVPVLTGLLDDPSVLGTVTVGDEPERDRYGLQLAAGGALAAILGEGAAPLLEQKLPGPNEYMTTEWVGLLSSIHRAYLSPGVLRLCDSSNEYLREAAIRAVAENDDGTVLRQHPQWARRRKRGFYFEVVRMLARNPRPEDEGLLRTALRDPDGPVARQALDALARLNPPDLDALLRRSLRSRHDLVAAGAMLHLAERGDGRMMQRLLRLLEAPWPPRRRARRSPADHEIARLIARSKPPGAEAALQAVAATARPPEWQTSFIGALAALGDEKALSRLRLLAHEGHPYAIVWLGYCSDTASADFLRNQLTSPDPDLREAARQALQEMGREEVGRG